MFNLFVSKKTYDAKVAELLRKLGQSQSNEAAANLRADKFEAKFKGAIRDLATRSDDIRGLRTDIIDLRSKISELTPLANAQLRRLERDRNRTRPSRAKSPAKAGKKS